VNEAPFVVNVLSTTHDRASFACGVEPLDRYFRQQASQDIRRRIATCFVLTESSTGVIAGYYTLAATNVLTTALPEAITAQLPRYAALPAVLIGRLAVSTAFRGQKLGSALLADAITRVARADIATYAVLVDPKDAAAERFYRHHGFVDLPPDRRMFIPIESALRYFRAP